MKAGWLAILTVALAACGQPQPDAPDAGEAPDAPPAGQATQATADANAAV